MIIQAFRYEFNKFGIKKVLILFAIIAFSIVVFFIATPTDNRNNYYDDLVQWSNGMKMLRHKNMNLSPNQQIIFDKCNKIISYKLSLLEQFDRDDIIKSHNVCARVQEIKTFHIVIQLLLAVFLAIILIGREQSNKEIYQGLIMPWKRSSIYIAKLLLATFIMLVFALLCFGVSYVVSRIYAGNQVLIDYIFINNKGQCSVMGFGLYYFIQFLLAIIPAILIYIFLAMLLVIIKKNSLSIIVLLLSLAGFEFFSYIGEYMGYFWYNLFPTKSFRIEEYIFTGTIINEVDTFNDLMKSVVAHQFDVFTIIFYDTYILFMLLCFGIDRFKIKDY